MVLSLQLHYCAMLIWVEKLSDKTLLDIMSMHNDEQEKMVVINVSKATYWISVFILITKSTL